MAAQAAVTEFEQLLASVRQRYNNGAVQDQQICEKTINQLKVLMISFDLVGPFSSDLTGFAKKQLLLAREALEYAVLIAVSAKDLKAFERNMAQLKPFYTDLSDLLPESERKHPIMGMQLLFLLASWRISEFHMELELVGSEAQSSHYIRLAMQLEQYLMEGAYNKVMNARKNAPLPQYTLFMDMLADTVREKIADCAEKAYEKYPLSQAAKLLMFNTQQEVDSFIQKRGWVVESGNIIMKAGMGRDKAVDVPALHTIRQTLHYATELVRIV